jgi:hypothetical protein
MTSVCLDFLDSLSRWDVLIVLALNKGSSPIGMDHALREKRHYL